MFAASKATCGVAVPDYYTATANDNVVGVVAGIIDINIVVSISYSSTTTTVSRFKIETVVTRFPVGWWWKRKWGHQNEQQTSVSSHKYPSYNKQFKP